MTIRFQVSGRQRLARLAARLREAAAGGLRNDLADALQRETPTALAAVRSAWMGVDVASSRGGGTKSTGLRARVAAATDATQNGLSVQFEVDGAAVGPYGRSLSWYLDGIGRWRHPVFGRRRIPWEQQYGEEVFFSTLYGSEPLWLEELERACEETARRIEG